MSGLPLFLGWLKARTIVPVFTWRIVGSITKIIVASGIMGFVVYYFREEYSFLIVIPVAAVIYGMLLLLFRAYTAEDWRWIKGVMRVQ